MFAAANSPFLARFFIVLPTRTSANSLKLSCPLDSALFQVSEDKGELTGWDQPIQDGSITQPAALHPSVCVFWFWLSRKCHHSTVLPTAKGQTGEIPAAYPDLERRLGTPGTRSLSLSVLGRRATGHGESLQLPLQTIPALQWWASSLSALQVLSPSSSSSHSPGGLGTISLRLSVSRSHHQHQHTGWHSPGSSKAWPGTGRRRAGLGNAFTQVYHWSHHIVQPHPARLQQLKDPEEIILCCQDTFLSSRDRNSYFLETREAH